MIQQYPLSIRDVPPCAGAVRHTGVRLDGTPDGIHTGGVWFVGDEAWKPLDGRPYQNCEFHFQTREDEVLEHMGGEDLFPKNWRVETANGRRFLVRKKAHVLTDFGKPNEFKDKALRVERAVLSLNSQGWEINDAISVAVDPEGCLFILDLSSAVYRTGKGIFAADDKDHIMRFFQQAGEPWLINLRRNGRAFATDITTAKAHRRYGYRHLYAAFRHITDEERAKIGDAHIVSAAESSYAEAKPLYWVITPKPLSREIEQHTRLSWAWSPVDWGDDE